MITVDIHNHLGFANMQHVHHHAGEKHIGYIGLCEHSFRFKEVCGTAMAPYGQAAAPVSIVDYIKNTSVSSREDAALMRGVELDLGGWHTDSAMQVCGRYHWDFIAGGIHSLDGVELAALSAQTKRDRRHLWAQYMKEQTRWVRRACFDFLAHPLRLAYAVRILPGELKPYAEHLAKACARAGMPVEINAIDFVQAPALVDVLAACLAEHGAHITIGSESSFPAEIGRCYDCLAQLLDRHRIEQCVVFCSRMPVTVNIHSGRLSRFGRPVEERSAYAQHHW